MVHEVKNIKTKLPRLKISIDFWAKLAGLAAIIGLLCACGATISTVLGLFLGYKLLRLIMRLLRLFLSVFFTLVSIIIVFLILSYLIF